MSLKDSLLQLIKSRGQITYGEAIEFAMKEGQRSSTMERRMRELCKEENIEPIMARSKRGTEYISAWRIKGDKYSAWDAISVVNSAIHKLPMTTINGKLVPIFAPKEKQKEVNQDRLI